MKRQIIKYCILLIYMLSLFSCRKDPIFIYEQTPDSLLSIFDDFWLKMNRQYLFWDKETTDWDRVRKVYRPKFEQLDINDQDDLLKATNYIKEITKNLIDGHFTIEISFENILNVFYQPAKERKRLRNDYRKLFNYRDIVKLYLDENYLEVKDERNITYGESLSVIVGRIDESILYFSCNYFSLYKSYVVNPKEEFKTVIDFFFTELFNEKKTDGLILDVRGILGGDLEDLNFLIGRMIDHPLHFGYTQYKNDSGRESYTPWVKSYVNPNVRSKTFKKKIIVIGDEYSASLAEFIILSVKTMQNGIFIGEKTWGATGVIVSSDIYNSGGFNIGKYLGVEMSSVRFKSLEGDIYEGSGISPDILVPFDLSALSKRRDYTLERAIKTIDNLP